uniref:Uncharacterized protein n=1 Tax=Plectus sambesii TaxID=2011161 RepID=A0A914VVX5_9BILA
MATSFGKKSHHLHIGDYEADMFTGITTYHGLVRIYNSMNWLSRWFWITVVVTSFSLFLLQAYQLLLMLDSKPTLTQINFNIPKNGIEFPSITICNFNPTMKSKVAKYNMSEEVQEYIQTAYTEVESLDDYFTNTTKLALLHQKYTEYVTNYNLTHPANESWRLEKFFFDTGFNCNDMLLECTYAGRTINCCDYVTEVMTDIGKCFRFGGNIQQKSLQRQVISGSSYGLHILIDVQKNETNSIDLLNYMDSGIKFYVHADGVLPILSSAGSAVSPGKKAYSAVSVRTIQLLEEDNWGVCQSDWDNPEEVLVHPNIYSNQNCEQNCIANKFNQLCGCVPLKYQFSANLTVCEPATLYNCTNNKHLVDSEDYWYKQCDCSVECDRIEYTVAVSYSAIPNDNSLARLNGHYNKSKQYIQENYLALAVYMKEIAFESHQQQKSIDRIAVLSDIGGSMGLFLGMSLITLGEIFIFIFKLIWGLTHRRRKNEIESRDHVGDPNKKQHEENNETMKDHQSSNMTLADNPNNRPILISHTSTSAPFAYNTHQTTFDGMETQSRSRNILKRLFSKQY